MFLPELAAPLGQVADAVGITQLILYPLAIFNGYKSPEPPPLVVNRRALTMPERLQATPVGAPIPEAAEIYTHPQAEQPPSPHARQIQGRPIVRQRHNFAKRHERELPPCNATY